MKFRYALLLLVIFLSAAICRAQERDFEIEIIPEEKIIQTGSEEIPVRVKITNRAEETLKTEGLDPLNFYFSKCPDETNCFSVQDVFKASYTIPGKRLSSNKSLEFKVNLAELFWFDRNDVPGNLNSPRSFAKIPFENIYFFADVKLFGGFKHYPGVDKKVPVYRVFRSNHLTVVLKP